MKIFINLFIVCVAAALGLIVGRAIHGKPAASSFGPAETSSAAMTTTAFRLTHTPTKTKALSDDSPLATKLARDLSMSAGVTRWLYWLDAIEKAQPSDFPRLASLAKGNSTSLRLLAARWVEVAPQHMFDYLALHQGAGDSTIAELAQVLFQEWPKADPSAVVAALSSTNFGSWNRNWRYTAVNALVEKDVELGLRALSDWNITSYSPSMKNIAKWAANDPRHAAEFALQHPAGYATETIMNTIGKEWAKKDPADALDFAASGRGEYAAKLASTTLKEWASRDLNAAAEWLGKTDAATRERLSSPFVEAWGKKDATAALEWCEANLTGTALARAAGSVLKGAAGKDANAAAALVAAMPPSSARAEAAASVASKLFPEFSSEKPVPPETLAWLSSLDGGSVRTVLERTQWQWSNTDPAGMAAFIAKLDRESVPSSTYDYLARTMARKDPLAALEWANQVPDDRRITFANDAFNVWQHSQPEAAREWVGKLPANDPRREPLFESAISFIANDPRGMEQIATLNPTERAAAQKIIERIPLPEERRARLLSMLKQR
jgi:hypothetical protein